MTFKNFILSAFFITGVGTFLSACQSVTPSPTSPSSLTPTSISPSTGNKSSSSANDESSHLNFIPEKNMDAFVSRGFDYDSDLGVFAFGSCANQDKPQPLWDKILNTSPKLFVFIGDTIYASEPKQKPIREQYTKLDKIPEYVKIRQQVPFMAIWDDHDYGQNDGGADNPEKEEARKEFLKYWRYVSDAIQPKQQGLYHSKILGPSHRLVQFIMLDTRWSRGPLVKSETAGRRYEPTSDATTSILGEEQWQWLERELTKKADLRFIVTTIQAIPNDHGFEKWGNFPHERERLFKLLKKVKAKNTVILSGDRHQGSVAKMNVDGFGDLYEITSSGINKTVSQASPDSSYIGQPYAEENFGLAKIDWENSKLMIELRNIKNEVVQNVDIPVRLEKRKPEVFKKEKKQKKRRRR